MISWSYYGLQSWMYLFGNSKFSDLAYEILFLLFIINVADANMDAVYGGSQHHDFKTSDFPDKQIIFSFYIKMKKMMSQIS